ncbi:MAG: hypothetical protein A2Z95_09600 [Gallionellales bacterium GWA2_60_18]|nr:MAG: hypothetical protein A2Z95_09600 [Gallionellales bacterium GWA2_60_18]
MKQNPLPDALPNFRNLGVTLRILLISNALGLMLAWLQANTWGDIAPRMMQIATLLTPVLLASLLLLWAAQPWLERMTHRRGALAVCLIAALLTLSVYRLGGEVYRSPDSDGLFDAVRYAFSAVLVCGVLLVYFRWRSGVLSHALHEARLQALHARIRPHFLFNTLNAVLSIVRSQPRQAEAALEDMADLFRMAMAEAHNLVPLRQELRLAEQYMALEQLRMGERLRVEWQVQDAPQDALIPPLLLQPLLENAVYHGIEPLPQGGRIRVELRRVGDEVHVAVENPCATREGDPEHPGSHIALRNIRDRLALLFDIEARYEVECGKNRYRVEIVLPYVKEPAA